MLTETHEPIACGTNARRGLSDIRIAILAPVFLLFAAGAQACPHCTDKIVSAKYPMAGPLLVLSIAYILLGKVVYALSRRWPRCYRGLAPFPFEAFGVVAVSGLVSVIAYPHTAGSLAPFMVAMPFWVGCLALRAVVQVAMNCKPAGWRALLGYHVVFMYLALAACIYTAMPSYQARYLKMSFGDIADSVIPRIINDGQTSVDSLISTFDKHYSRPAAGSLDRYEAKCALESSAYCLGKIGGAKAEAFLADVIQNRLRLSDKDAGGVWQGYAVFAYAECARERAVDPLIELYTRSDDKETSRRRWIPVAGLVRTCSPNGVAFALGHVDDLINAGDKAAWATLKALVDGRDLEQLTRVPVYRQGTISGAKPLHLSRGDRRADFYAWAGDRETTATDPVSEWRDHSREIRERWLALDAPTSPSSQTPRSAAPAL